MSPYRIDFRKVDLLQLKAVGILPDQIARLFVSPNGRVHRYATYLYVIACTAPGKFLHAAFLYHKSVNFDIDLLEAGFPNAEEIAKYWCTRQSES